jgi:hypothetical protein
MGFSDKAFTRQVHPARIVFGAGRLDSLPAEAARLNAERVLLISSGSAGISSGSAGAAATRAAALLGTRLARPAVPRA